MHDHTRSLRRLVWSGLALLILVVLAAFLTARHRARQPSAARSLEILSQVGEFSLTNQFRQPVHRADLTGQVWIADIIFTRCPGPCVQMTRRMRELQEVLPPDLPIKLVSLTTDPDFDTPEVLQAYGRRFGAQGSNWWFLTGSKEEIQRLAVDGLKLVLQEKPAEQREVPDDLFLHSTLFAVVDRVGRMRAVFEMIPRTDDEEEADSAAQSESGADPFSERTRRELLKAVLLLSQEGRGFTVRDLPLVNASLNGLSAALLVAGFVFIRRGNREVHRRCMIGALTASVLFLACYLTYHGVVGHTAFRNPGWVRPYYLGLLASHVILATVIVPLVLLTLRRALAERFTSHKKLARWTWPLWMYVSVTGVVIYIILYVIWPQ